MLIAVTSATLEALQIFVPRRAPSVDDLIFNVIGGALSLLVVIAADLKYHQNPTN